MHLIHLAKVQVYILYKESVRKPKSQYEFTKDLIRQLVGNAPMKKSFTRRNPPELERLTGRHFITHVPSTKNKKYAQRHCHVCSFRDPSKENRYLRKDTRFMCEQCDLAMCFEPCFKIFRTRKDYKAAAKEALNLNF